jgi:transcriptional regulator of nitric oxide reductase
VDIIKIYALKRVEFIGGNGKFEFKTGSCHVRGAIFDRGKVGPLVKVLHYVQCLMF